MAYPPSTPQPTQAGFLAWVRGVMGVPVQWLPDDSQAITDAYEVSVATVNPIFCSVPGSIYRTMVYNLAGHLLAMWAPDVTTMPPYPYKTVDGVPYGYFQYLRQQNNMLGFTTGVVQASSDEGTSVSLTVPKSLENLTLSQLSLLSTPWGRTYLGYAQDWNGPWGRS